MRTPDLCLFIPSLPINNDIFRCVLASLHEVVPVGLAISLSVVGLVGPSVGPSVGDLFFYMPKMKDDATFELIAQ